MFFQAAGTSPMLGQAHHFRNYSVEKIQCAIGRYTNEGKRLYVVMSAASPVEVPRMRRRCHHPPTS